jgi:hypothetical protein
MNIWTLSLMMMMIAATTTASSHHTRRLLGRPDPHQHRRPYHRRHGPLQHNTICHYVVALAPLSPCSSLANGNNPLRVLIGPITKTTTINHASHHPQKGLQHNNP